ncbi:1-aminocyclopropane-1-carboxylate synthase, putative [Medicago truncatula]|uniref:1-aminocyclopropane-1-carboxylate synthase, putative n=1 Tax=Medicago truncatula TaxID=3880 RepID=G7L8A2_MEDTR|nr:1-aminocyclopropane-1-carboxylate synthase, putative [Medicago truncatula]
MVTMLVIIFTIHFVCDRIYVAAVFTSPTYASVSEVILEMKCKSDLIHIIYSLSNHAVNCVRKMSSFGLVKLNICLQSSRTLLKRHEKFTEDLKRLKLVDYM